MHPRLKIFLIVALSTYAMLSVAEGFVRGWSTSTIDEVEARMERYCDMVSRWKDSDGETGWPDYHHSYDQQCPPGGWPEFDDE